MNFTKLLKLSTLGLGGIIFTGCMSSQPTLKNTSLDNIKNEKYKILKNKIKLTNLSFDKKYKAYISKNNNLKFIDIYKSNYKPSSIEEIIYFNKDGYDSTLSINKKDVRCGYGSLTGYLCLLGIQYDFLKESLHNSNPNYKMKSSLKFGYVDYSKLNSKYCDSRFVSVDGYETGLKFGIGLGTFLTPFITGAGIYTVKFDKDKFKDAIIKSKLYLIKEPLINDVYKYEISKGGFDIIYLDNLEKALGKKYKSLFMDKSIKSGIVFLNKENDNFTIIPFNKYTGETFDVISLEIKDLLNDISKNHYEIKYEDILKFIPPKIEKPTLPPVKELVKSEFETKQQFKQRVKKSLQERNEKIQKLKEKYMLDVLERNLYIDNLQKSYQNYLIDESNSNNQLFNKVKNNIPMLSKVLVLEQFTYKGKNFSYDAETQKLYFSIYSNKENLNINAYAIMSPQEAKKIKLENKYKIVPIIEFKNNQLKLEKFNIVELDTKNQYEVKYTDKLYKPDFVSANIITLNEKIQTQISEEFKKYKQKVIPFDNKLNVVYINNIKYKLQQPKWFSNPPMDKFIAYGVGKSYEEALSNARNELAKMIKVKIKVEYSSKIGFKNFKTLKEIKENTNQTSNITLTKDDYRTYKQSKINNIWYVGLEYVK